MTSIMNNRHRVTSTVKKTDSPAEEDSKGLSVEGEIDWEPRSYSRFTFTALRSPGETATADSALVRKLFRVGWQHDFNSRLSLDAGIYDGVDDYSGTREDDRFGFNVGLSYEFRRWLELAARFRYSERDSNEPLADYEDQRFMITMEISR